MLEIFFIRHGESVGNKEERFRGRCDFELNENGLKQAEALRQELAGVEFSAVYSSPLQRALKTAQTMADSRMPVIKAAGFTNIALGAWENQPKVAISLKYPELWQIWLTQPEKLVFDGMETLPMVQKRSYQALQELLTRHQDGKIAVVSHRAVLKPLFAAMLGMSEPYFWRIQLDTASYSIAEYRPDRGFTFTMINQNKHLNNYLREELG
jgi:broad specificity phosphatase PhoE